MKSVKGYLDLTSWDLHKDGPVKLNGEWEFYWKMLEPADFDSEKITNRTSYIDKEGVIVYPNPNAGNFTLRLNIGSHNNVSIDVFDALNKKIYSEKNKSVKNGNEINFNFENYSEGLYYIRITSSEFNFIEKLIIRK